MSYLIQPTGTPISASTYAAWQKKNGLSPWDELTSAQEAEVNALAAIDPATLTLITEATAAKVAQKAEITAKEAAITDITEGLDRETVMAMAKRLIGDSDYWPKIDGDTLTVYGNEEKAVWNKGDDGWTVFTTSGSPDSGAGYGANQ